MSNTSLDALSMTDKSLHLGKSLNFEQVYVTLFTNLAFEIEQSRSPSHIFSRVKYLSRHKMSVYHL